MPSAPESSNDPLSAASRAIEKDLETMDVDFADAPLDDEDPLITPGEVKREVRDSVRAHERRRRQFPRAFVVGLLVGLVGVCFRGMLNFAESWRENLFHLGHQYWWGLPVAVLFGAFSRASAWR